MPDGDEPIRIDIIRDLGAVARAEWDSCAGPENPFVSHDFLYSLEESRSACPDEGWLPQHLIIQDEAGTLVGAVPLYLKSHSQGEYVFDYGWAHAYERAGGRYYPKLLSAVPFTPVTGPRLMVRPGHDDIGIRSALIAGLMEVTRQHGVSSLHVNFATETDADALQDAGFLIRHGQQYHWHNQGYGSFDDFLATLSSRKRKNIRKERRKVIDSGLHIERLTGDDLQHHHWDAFYHFYQQTYDRKWGHPYLTRQFFRLLQERMRDRVLLILVHDRGMPVAGALNLIGTECLFGRNWGSDGRYPFLHFEACYYQAIEFAIERGLARVEAGTQGEHKVQRGYLPVRTYSAHHIVDPGFRDAVERFLMAERDEVTHVMEYLDDHSPYKRGP